MKTTWLRFGLALCVLGAAGGCKRKASDKPPAIQPAALAQAGEEIEPRSEPTVVGEHLTAQALTDDLVLYTLQIEFDTDAAVIRSAYFADLDKIGKALAREPEATARIDGHADRRDSSSPEYNQQLSRRRAAAVADYLQTKAGIAAKRLTAAGFGYERPLEPNDPANGSPKNRRVEVLINRGAETPDGPAPAAIEQSGS